MKLNNYTPDGQKLLRVHQLLLTSLALTHNYKKSKH